MNRVDLTVFQWFNGWGGLSDIRPIGFLSYWFLENSAAILLGLFALFSLSGPTKPGRMRMALLLSGLSGLAAMAVAIVLSIVLHRARPIAVLPPVEVHIVHQSFFESSLDSSFPCLHAAVATACAAAMWRAPNWTARWLFAGMAALIGINRLIAGHHWPSDIIASWVLGVLVTQGVFAVGRPLLPVVEQFLGSSEHI